MMRDTKKEIYLMATTQISTLVNETSPERGGRSL